MISEYDFVEPKRFVWPWQRHRLHLEDEIAWLKAQLAQTTKRNHDLEDALIDIKRPVPKVQYERKPDGKLVPVQPRGWMEYRAHRAANPQDEPEAVEGPFKTEGEPHAIQSN